MWKTLGSFWAQMDPFAYILTPETAHIHCGGSGLALFRRPHLRLVGLEKAADKLITQISGGMKQRVAIAQALAIRPEVLILDEPFAALDAITKEELQVELLQIWNTQKCTVLMITHDIDEALFLADRLVMMTNGPAAGIGDVMTIDFPRPRNREDIMEDPRYYELRNQALDFLYNRFAHDEDEVA
jgi:bicarbonate transport system ATP-binding protein